MAKGIYCLKIFGFRHQLTLSKHEISSLRRNCLFISTIYASFWISAPLPTAAPTNDLCMLQLIKDYEQVDEKVAAVAQKKMRLHLWYLSEDLAALPLFSDDVTNVEKHAMVWALQHRDPHPDDLRRLPPNMIPDFRGLSIRDFVTQRSRNLFMSLNLPQGSFLLKQLKHGLNQTIMLPTRQFAQWKWSMTVQNEQLDWPLTSTRFWPTVESSVSFFIKLLSTIASFCHLLQLRNNCCRALLLDIEQVTTPESLTFTKRCNRLIVQMFVCALHTAVHCVQESYWLVVNNGFVSFNF